jgi:ABC-2 type transport system ATP-binding protein
MHYRASEPIERPLFALSLDTLAGVFVWSHNNRDGGCVPEKIVGEGSLDIRIPRLNLQAGTFDLHASINNYLWTHIYDRWRYSLRFDVLARPNHDGGGIVDLGGTWAVPGVVDAP